MKIPLHLGRCKRLNQTIAQEEDVSDFRIRPDVGAFKHYLPRHIIRRRII